MFDVCLSINWCFTFLLLLLSHFQGTPQITEKTIDSQKAVDNKIKEKCEEFISFTYDYLAKDLNSFILATNFPAVTATAAMVSEGGGVSGDSTEEKAAESSVSPVKLCKLRLKELVQTYQSKKTSIEKSMSLYLANSETEAIIFKQVKTKIQLLYEQLVKILLTKFPSDSDKAELEIPPLKAFI